MPSAAKASGAAGVPVAPSSFSMSVSFVSSLADPALHAIASFRPGSAMLVLTIEKMGA
jgi:hypothetical protein